MAHGRRGKSMTSACPSLSPVADQLLDRIWTTASDHEVRRLFRLQIAGEPGQYSASEDDFELACIVPRYGGEPDVISEVMHDAAIKRDGHREKWSSNRGYVPRTIEAACRSE